MPKDESNDFRPRLGKPRDRLRKGPRTTTALIVRSVAQQGGDLRRLSQPPRDASQVAGSMPVAVGEQPLRPSKVTAAGNFMPITRTAQACALEPAASSSKRGSSSLRVWRAKPIAAHLRYLQREGVTIDARRGRAYSAVEDEADPKVFAERGSKDRHQFRFIVAAEDGVALGSLRPFTRRLMRQMEQDLDTVLDWVAVDHYNTGHPHTHVVVRGVTDEGKILYIAGNYIAHGIRARASDLVTRELGRQSELEVQQKLGREVDEDRFTRLDQTLLDQAQDGRVDLRISPGQSYLVRVNRHLLISRLEKLKAMQLATPIEPGVWHLSPQLKPILTQLGERIDTLNLMRDALGEAAAHRAVANYMIHRDVPRSPVTGHLVGKGLAGDGLGDNAYLVDRWRRRPCSLHRIECLAGAR